MGVGAPIVLNSVMAVDVGRNEDIPEKLRFARFRESGDIAGEYDDGDTPSEKSAQRDNCLPLTNNWVTPWGGGCYLRPGGEKQGP